MHSASILATGVAVAWALACGGTVETPTPVPPVPVPGPAVLPTPPPAAASRCPTGTHLADLWQGEYPSPVVDVKSAVAVPGRAAPCDGAAKGPCTIPPGLYHPWSTSTTAGFATIVADQKYKARRAWSTPDNDGKPLTVPAGSEVAITYLGEGFCDWTVGDVGFVAECPEMVADAQGDVFEELPAVTFDSIEVLEVACREGNQAWIDVNEALFALAEVEEGVIMTYGEVAPSGTPGGFGD